MGLAFLARSRAPNPAFERTRRGSPSTWRLSGRRAAQLVVTPRPSRGHLPDPLRQIHNMVCGKFSSTGASTSNAPWWPQEILKRCEKWKDIAGISGPLGLRQIAGFHDEALSGAWNGHRSSRLGRAVSRMICRVDPDECNISGHVHHRARLWETVDERFSPCQKTCRGIGRRVGAHSARASGFEPKSTCGVEWCSLKQLFPPLKTIAYALVSNVRR